MIEGASAAQIAEKMGPIAFGIYSDSLNGNYVVMELGKQELKKYQDLLDAEEEYRGSLISINEVYRDQPDGLAGNEDCGQMSAWYIFSALGFYPVCPGSPEYAIGSPIVDKAVIHFEDGKSFTIKANNNENQNVYIQSAKLNGIAYNKSYLNFEDIAKGGTLELDMSNAPNEKWGVV